MRNPKSLRHVGLVAIGSLFIALLAGPSDGGAPVPPGRGHELTASDLETFLDIYMPLQLARDNIAGAAIAVVKDDKILLARGYGYADVAQKTPVSADGTLFRLGSISKLFTWIAVMQQVERGKLDLDRDVNDYLDFKIPSTFEKPITLRNLMTHTAGFEESAKDMQQPDAASIKPLGDYIRAHVPARIFAAGTIPAYSNYGAALAGYIVERVTGEKMADYAAERLFKPLGMDHTTFVQPPPDALGATMSRGYQLGSGDAQPFEFYQIYPAGAASASAMDMARFALALLHNGAGERGRILQPQTVGLMFTRQFSYRKDMSGMGLGFFDQSRNGRRIIGHSGDTGCFHSDLHLVPELNLGFFVAYNSAGRSETGATGEIWRAFLDRYVPYTLPNESTLATAKDDARRVVGSYIASRRAETTMLAANNFFSTTDVVANADGTITVQGWRGLNGQPTKFREIGPLMYRDVEGQGRLAFQPDPAGRMTLVTDTPIFIYQRVPFMRSGHFVTNTLKISLGTIALALLLWPVAAMIRRHYGVKLELSRFQRRLRLAAFLVCAIDIAIILVPAVAMSLNSNTGPATTRLDPMLWAVQVMALLCVIGTPIVIFRAIWVWRDRMWWGTRLQAAAVALACIVFSWFLIAVNLLRFSVRY
jgi:CubicO group peptidase (beta-lactamase class C family)